MNVLSPPAAGDTLGRTESAVCQKMLDTLAGDVRSHLALAARVLADLQPRSRSTETSAHANR